MSYPGGGGSEFCKGAYLLAFGDPAMPRYIVQPRSNDTDML